MEKAVYCALTLAGSLGPFAPRLCPACGTGSFAITNLLAPPGAIVQANALNSAGQLAGYYYIEGVQDPHAFRYDKNGFVDLGTLGGSISEGLAINASGAIAGDGFLSDFSIHAFVESGGSLVDLGTLGGTYSSPVAINDAGQVAGSSVSAAGAFRAFLLSNGSLLSLGDLGGNYSSAYALNNAGAVVGGSSLANGDQHGFLSANAVMSDLGTLGGNYSTAYALNSAAVVVGESSLANGDVHAFVYANGLMSDLGSLGGNYSSAFGINSNGQVIGYGSTAAGQYHGFVFSGGALLDLGTLGGPSSLALANNNQGQVVGYADTADGSTHAVLWQNGQLVDLNTLLPAGSGWELFAARFINDAGRIIGDGALNGVSQPFILDLAPANSSPVAIAGPDRTLSCDSQATLDGSQSSDPDGNPLAFAWSLAGTPLGTNAMLALSLPMGTNVVLLTVTDPCGASSQATVTLVVQDLVPPAIVCPSAVTAPCDGQCHAAVPNLSSQASVTDNCTPSQLLAVTQVPPAGTLLGAGPHIVTLTVADLAGNLSSSNVLFTVVDSTPPTILSSPVSLTLPADGNCHALLPDLRSDLHATDNCSSQLVIAQDPPAGTPLTRGSHSVQLSVADSAGNAATTTVAVTVADLTPPLITSLVASPNVLTPPNHQMVPIALTVVASDNCDGSPVTKVFSVTANESTAPGDIVVTGPLSLSLAASRNPAGSGRVYTITVSCSDASGNSSTATVQVTVPQGNGNGNGRR